MVAEILAVPDVHGAIIGTCPAMREVYKAIGRVATQDIPLLTSGESSTGKELVARALGLCPRANAGVRWPRSPHGEAPVSDRVGVQAKAAVQPVMGMVGIDEHVPP